MFKSLQQEAEINHLSSIKDKFNGLDLSSPVTFDDNCWVIKASDGGDLTLDFSVFDSDQFLWTDSVVIGSDKYQSKVSIKTLAKILFVGIHSGIANHRSAVISTLLIIKMLFFFLAKNKSHQLKLSELERFLCFCLVNEMDGLEVKRLISPSSYTNRPILTQLRKIRFTLNRYDIDGILDAFPNSELAIKMNAACETMLGMTFNDYIEGGSHNYLGLEVGKHYIDHCYSFIEKHFLFVSALNSTLKTFVPKNTSASRAALYAKVLIGETLNKDGYCGSYSLSKKLDIEALIHAAFRRAYNRNAPLDLLFKLSTVSHFVEILGLSDRYDAQEFVRCLFMVEVFGERCGKTKRSIWKEYEAAIKHHGEKISISIEGFDTYLNEFIKDNADGLPSGQVELREYLSEKVRHLKDIFSLTSFGQATIKSIILKIKQVGALCFLAATGWRRSECEFTSKDILISSNADASDNFYTPWRFHIHWFVPKTNDNSKVNREITSTTYILLQQVASINNNPDTDIIIGNGDTIYEGTRLLWADFVDNYELFKIRNEEDEAQWRFIEKVKEEVRTAFPLYQLANTPDGLLNLLQQYRDGNIDDDNKTRLEKKLPVEMLEKISSPDIELTSKNVSTVKSALLKDVKYPSPHAFRHIWAEAILMRYRGPVGSFIRANFQHMDERFFMAYLRDKDMKMIYENAERSFISWVSQQYADLGKEAFGETISQLPRFIELSTKKTFVLPQKEYQKKIIETVEERIESVKANPWGTCIRRSGTDYRAACSKSGVPHTHEASPTLCLGCTNVDITKENLLGIMVYTRQEVEACLSPNLPIQLKAPHIDTVKRALSAVVKLKTRSKNPTKYDKAIADFESALAAARDE